MSHVCSEDGVLRVPRSSQEGTAPAVYLIPPALYSYAVTYQALNAAFIEGHFPRASYPVFSTCPLRTPSTTLAEQGQRYYGQMLRLLQGELSCNDPDLTAVIGTVCHLLLCESAKTRQHHFAGMAALADRIALCAPDAPLTIFVLRSARLLLLTYALFTRDPGPVNPISRYSSQQTCQGPGFERLINHVERVPHLLQAADRADESGDSMLLVVQELRDLEVALEKSLGPDPLYSVNGTGKTWSTSDVHFHPSLQPFLARLEQMFGPPTTFQSFHIANIYILYWSSLLLLRMSMLRLSRLAASRGDLAALAASKDRDLEAECFACGTLLCRSIPSLLREPGGNISQAASVSAPLYLAQQCFDTLGLIAQLEWVQEVTSEMRSHYRSLNWDALLPWSFLALVWR
ncbi:hypothetical protein LTR56_000321 [Elasticomyces elasticus]|nr:hypothetical protein LTR56_000321 [Elasticomyces elasticus]KAK3666983.1 hypothetical protein LTR22_002208 [Elasticomyces elasticus]KAK4933313.1 hypothetical protein LTR49_000307 [Elasticomyces elasticus]KAK5757333.1 hypothetical protein LTS12_012545 [Elasticomyces elasticus]